MQFNSRFTAMVLYLYYNCLKREWTALLLGKEERRKKNNDLLIHHIHHINNKLLFI